MLLSPLFFSAFVLSFHFLLFNHFFSLGDSIQVHCVDLGESFQTHIYLENLASIQPRTSPTKLGREANALTHGGVGAGRRRPRGAGVRPVFTQDGMNLWFIIKTDFKDNELINL